MNTLAFPIQSQFTAAAARGVQVPRLQLKAGSLEEARRILCLKDEVLIEAGNKGSVLVGTYGLPKKSVQIAVFTDNGEFGAACREMVACAEPAGGKPVVQIGTVASGALHGNGGKLWVGDLACASSFIGHPQSALQEIGYFPQLWGDAKGAAQDEQYAFLDMWQRVYGGSFTIGGFLSLPCDSRVIAAIEASAAGRNLKCNTSGCLSLETQGAKLNGLAQQLHDKLHVLTSSVGQMQDVFSARLASAKFGIQVLYGFVSGVAWLSGNGSPLMPAPDQKVEAAKAAENAVLVAADALVRMAAADRPEPSALLPADGPSGSFAED